MVEVENKSLQSAGGRLWGRELGDLLGDLLEDLLGLEDLRCHT